MHFEDDLLRGSPERKGKQTTGLDDDTTTYVKDLLFEQAFTTPGKADAKPYRISKTHIEPGNAVLLNRLRELEADIAPHLSRHLPCLRDKRASARCIRTDFSSERVASLDDLFEALNTSGEPESRLDFPLAGLTCVQSGKATKKDSTATGEMEFRWIYADDPPASAYALVHKRDQIGGKTFDHYFARQELNVEVISGSAYVVNESTVRSWMKASLTLLQIGPSTYVNLWRIWELQETDDERASIHLVLGAAQKYLLSIERAYQPLAKSVWSLMQANNLTFNPKIPGASMPKQADQSTRVRNPRPIPEARS